MSVLASIAAYKRDEVAQAKTETPLAQLAQKARRQSPPRGFLAALARAKAEQRPALIGEIKKASPLKGVIRKNFEAADLARAYEHGGATCLSVLTDTPSFQGSATDLEAARAACSLPVLRKDFILDPYQVVQSRAMGADCVLLILAMIDDGLAVELAADAHDWGMDCLVETHSEVELDRAARLGASLIGINSRDLATFETNLTATIRLAARAPTGAHIVAESGLTSQVDLRALAQAGITSYLIGESLMRADDVAQATRSLLEGVQ
ncbi:MAG: indole-3-glycerol phosphate synthase TrpC [Alphaproteobacteria bacterium]